MREYRHMYIPVTKCKELRRGGGGGASGEW